ncbi:MAG: ABC transporter substrate-binding protein [Alphaproteobacteria bacterium]
MRFLLTATAIFLAAHGAAQAADMPKQPHKVARAAMAKPVQQPRAEAQQSAQDVVKTFYGQLLFVMQRGDKLGFEGRYAQLKPAIERALDLPMMTRFAVGSDWFKAAPAEQQRLIAAFSDFSVATYASRFAGFSGEKFEVIGEKPAPGGGMIVETRLVPHEGETPVTLNYLLRQDANKEWRINDVYLDATISELAVRHAEFSSVIRDDGVQALIDVLDKKAKGMKNT